MDKKLKLMIENFSIEQTRKFSTPLPIYEKSLYYLIQNHDDYSTLSLTKLIKQKKRSIQQNKNHKLFKKMKRNINIPFFENKDFELNNQNVLNCIFSFYKKQEDIDDSLISHFKEDKFEISNEVIKLWNKLNSELNDKVKEELNIISSIISTQRYLNLNEMLDCVNQHLIIINNNIKQKEASMLFQLCEIISNKLNNNTKTVKHLLDRAISIKDELALLNHAKNSRNYTIEELKTIKENALKIKNCSNLINDLRKTNNKKFNDFLLEFKLIYNSNFIKNEAISKYKSDFYYFINKIIKWARISTLFLNEEEWVGLKNQVYDEIYHQLISNYSFDLWQKNQSFLYEHLTTLLQKHFDKYAQIGKIRVNKINSILNNSKEVINKIKNNSRYVWVKNNLTKEIVNTQYKFKDLKYELNWYLNNSKKKINNEIIINKLFFEQNERKMLNNNVRLSDLIKQTISIIKPVKDIINKSLWNDFNNTLINLKTKSAFETKRNLFKILLRNTRRISSSTIKKFISICSFVKKIDVFGFTPTIFAENCDKINQFNKLKLNLLAKLLNSNGILQVDLISFLDNNLFYQWINEKKNEIKNVFNASIIFSIDKKKLIPNSINFKKEGGDFLLLLCNNILTHFIDLRQEIDINQLIDNTNFNFHLEFANAIKIYGQSFDNLSNLSKCLINKKTKLFTKFGKYEIDKRINEYDRYVKGE